MVTVHIKLGEKKDTMELPEGACIDSLLNKLGPKWADHALVLVNGKVANPGRPLYSTDRVVVLPLMSGG